MSEMDTIDSKQQEEINALQIKDVEHDLKLGIWTKLYLALFVVTIALFVGGVILLPLVTMRDGIGCPHAECVHHQK